jgi:hypothetical protein
MATKTEVLAEAAQAEWLDMTVDECREYAHDFGFVRESAGGIDIVDLTKAEEHFIDAWVEREYDVDHRYDMDPRV